MITQTMPAWQTLNWKEQLRTAITDVDQLLALVGLDKSELALNVCRQQAFPLRVPLSFVQRMEYGNPDDPLLRQVLPVQVENRDIQGFSKDPLQENRFNPVPGIIHKYHGRVLLIVSPACAIHCRYCFRRHFPYEDNRPGKNQWQQAFHYIEQNREISEVILSGGDPLSAGDEQLSGLAKRLQAIPHLKRLRVHTRLPVVIPSRIDEHCLAWLGQSRLATSVVLHINHSNEIDDNVADMAAKLRQNNIQLLNQAVLMQGINDSAKRLISLHEKLFATGILPYYLHTLDPVKGAWHFDLPLSRARELHRLMRQELPGYLVPRLVRDLPDQAAKTLVN